MEKLIQETHQLTGLQLSPRQFAALERYRQLLLEWNSVHNLTAIREPDEMRVKHFLDSISLALVLRSKTPERVVDVGTGAGFPGLVIKILYPQTQLTLVESISKKLEFCQLVVQALEMEGVSFLAERAEKVGHDPRHRESYDLAVARAVANLPVLAEYLLPLVRRGGLMIAMKGESAPAEAHSAEHAIQLLGGHLRRLLPVTLPGVVEQRYLVLIDKQAPTPDGYPRRTGIPNKRPLSA